MAAIKEVCLYCNSGHRKDAIWAAAYTGDSYLCVWGARGTKYQERGSKFGLTLSAARREFDTKLAQKLAKGYKIVAFEDLNFGAVKPFSKLLALPVSKLLAELANHTDRLATNSIVISEPDRILEVQMRLVSKVLTLAKSSLRDNDDAPASNERATTDRFIVSTNPTINHSRLSDF